MKGMCEKPGRVIKSASGKLTGRKRRAYQAEVTVEFSGGSVRMAEKEMGWGRETVRKGIREAETGTECPDNFQGRGRKKTEDKFPNMEKDIRDIADPHSQSDPDFKNDFLYIKITAKAVRDAPVREKGYKESELPSENTIGNMLNRMGYSLKRVLKAKPVKKFPKPMRYLRMSGR
jgi:transposase